MMRRLALAALVALPTIVLAPATSSSVAAEGGGEESSAVTVHGKGRFSDLAVTVPQTKHLLNQVLAVTWTGGEQTPGDLSTDYLQIMQCWGDEAEPDREKCQFGALGGGQYWESSRQLNYGTLVDPEESTPLDPNPGNTTYLPFKSVTGDIEKNGVGAFFGPYTTNEIPIGRTSKAGTGLEYVEMQTAREAPGLGCGAIVPDESTPDPSDRKGRSCWLVVVPRDKLEVNGQIAEEFNNRVVSSPLSASNWKHHLAVRLEFDPVGLVCPIGTPERRLLGSEISAEAINHWQPVLCGKTGAIFGFSQVSDDLGRKKVLDKAPWLSIVQEPIASPPKDKLVVYAPLTISAIGVAFNIDREAAFRAPAEIVEKEGTRVPDLKLTPRLLAKLMTQSYQGGTLSEGEWKYNNPVHLTKDPEFVGLNPEFEHLFQGDKIKNVLEPLGLSDAASAVWSYIASDREAMTWVNGSPDRWGMVVNPAYKGMSLDRADYPRQDLAELKQDGIPPLQALDAFPYAADMADGTRSGSRGDTKVVGAWDSGAIPPAYKKVPRQAPGHRSMLALADTPAAARFSLPMVALRNAAGKFVTPTPQSIAAGVAEMTASGVPGVLLTNPAATSPDAYPLPVISYAATTPALLSETDAKDYAAFLRYAAGEGQEPGEQAGKLPEGYVPLSDSMSRQTLAAADQVAARVAAPPVETPAEPDAKPSKENEETGPEPDSPNSTTSTAEPLVPLAPGPVGVPPVAGVTTQAAGAPAMVSFKTPTESPGPLRFLVVGALVAAALAALARPLILMKASRGRPS